MQSMNSVFLHKVWAEDFFGRSDVTEKLGIKLHSNNYRFLLVLAWILVLLFMFSGKKARPPR